MIQLTLDHLTERLDLADQLLAGRDRMLEPRDLPGRYGRVVKALDHVLEVTSTEAVVAGGWAVWRHGFLGRVTQDIDIVLPATKISDFLQTASMSGFQVLSVQPGRWPKLVHRETGVDVDILPEGGRPGTPSKQAPTTIPHPKSIGGAGFCLKYAKLTSLIELKLAAGRAQDEADIVKLIQTNQDQISAIQQHLAAVHPDYEQAYLRIVERARDEDSRECVP